MTLITVMSNRSLIKIILLAVLPITVFVSIIAVYFKFQRTNLLSVFAGSDIYDVDDDSSFLSVLNVGEAQSVLVASCGEVALIDTGNDDDLAADMLNRYGIKHLDYILISHYHEDHFGGLESICESYTVGEVILPPRNSSDDSYQDYIDVKSTVKNSGAQIFDAYAGQSVTVGRLKVKVLAFNGHLNDENDKSLVISVDDGEYSVNVMGDIGETVENMLIFSDADISAFALVAAHHGSGSSNSNRFLNAIGCEYVIASCGAPDIYGLPDDEMVSRVENNDIQLYTTYENGIIRIDYTDTKPKIITER